VQALGAEGLGLVGGWFGNDGDDDNDNDTWKWCFSPFSEPSLYFIEPY
jgi:hypothetical protein